MDRHGSGLCNFKCKGSEYACGGYFSSSTYSLADAEYEPEVVDGAKYLGCFLDKADDRVMLFEETGGHMTAEV